ncbi:MAG: type II toxin-antitoxin system RelE/ParE family toxin [Planctomycetes bacterium]|nr:type II toxin-antitoxin system RelE/ParE family toxin [Planctomycetota bacterium]
MAEGPGFLDEAWQEVVEAADWYEARLEGLGDRVYAETDEAIDRIAKMPDVGAPWRHRRIQREVRRIPLRSFPFMLFYLTTSPPVVVAFAHKNRRPGYWTRRLGDV